MTRKRRRHQWRQLILDPSVQTYLEQFRSLRIPLSATRSGMSRYDRAFAAGTYPPGRRMAAQFSQ